MVAWDRCCSHRCAGSHGDHIAHVESVQTGQQVELHIRGRVFRYAKNRRRAQKAYPVRVRTNERRRICVLDASAALRLEHWNQASACYGPTCTHRHYTREAVQALVESGELRWMAGNNTAAHVRGRTWKPAPSDGMTVLQLTVGV